MFAPDRAITRQEMFTLLYNALKVIKQLPETSEGNKPVRTLSDFTDEENIDTWAKEAISELVEAGIINGYAGRLNPLSKTTRAEMAQVLYNLLAR